MSDFVLDREENPHPRMLDAAGGTRASTWAG